MSKPVSQKGKRHSFDVLVLGAGLAGLSYVVELAREKPDCQIALFSKSKLSESNSRYAQGGIASVTLKEDSFEQHVQDTLKAGDGLCDETVVNEIVSSAPEAIEFLESCGVCFDKQETGALDLGQEGGHSHRRGYHVGDETGRGLVEALLLRLKELRNVTVFENHMAVNLISQTEKHKPGARRQVIGAYMLNSKGLVDTFLAKIVVLATGGAGKIYRYTSNPSVATGDGIALAYRAGARVGNLEFYQFHPTLLFHPKLNSFLISEALRGEGATLKTADTEERFMKRYDKKNMEMATRDVISKAIFTELESSSQKFVYLDIRHRGREFLEKRFPTICKKLLSIGLDMSEEMIPVVPGAHYSCGGVLADVEGHTDINGLFAIGEVVFTGLHGANRLPCNSLLETVVMGRRSAKASYCFLEKEFKLIREIQDWDSKSVVDSRRASQINAHWRSLRGEMTSYAGIVRTKSGLNVLLNLILARREMIENYYWRHVVTEDSLELRNILQVAELIVRSALARHESRGGHYREDYPHALSDAEETVFRSSKEPRIKSTMNERPQE